ncbi:tetratricopeptide repeat protein [bacterium]|nr:tetratricopeptide repeat protein [bacterium]
MKITKLLSILAFFFCLCSASFAAPSAASEEAVNKALKTADKSLTSAIPLLENAEKNFPFHPANMEVLYQLAMAYVEVGRYDDANKTLDKLSQRYGKYADTIQRVDEAKVAKAHVLVAQGKYDEALALIQKFLREVPKSPARNSAYLEYAKVLVKKGRYDEAKKQIADFTKNPNNELFIPSSYVLAEIYVRNGQSDEAEKMMRNILKTTNNKDVRIATFYKLGEIYRGCSNYVGAINVYRRIKTPGKKPDEKAQNAGILWEIAQTYEQLGHFLEARIGFDGIMRLYPEVEFSTQAWFRAVQSDISAGDFKRAENSYIDFIKAHPGNDVAAPVRLAIAQALMETNQFKEAVRNLKAGLEEYKEGEIAENMYFSLGSALLGAQEYKEAEDTLKQFAEKFPESSLVPQSYLRLTEGYIEQKRFQDALNFLEKTIADFPEFAREYKLDEYSQEITLAYATAEAEQKNFEKAEELCATVTLPRLREQSLYLQADMCVKQGNYEKGVEVLENMLKEFEDSDLQADILMTLGGVYMNQRQYDKAKETFDRVVALEREAAQKSKPLAVLQKAFCSYYANDMAGMKENLEVILKDYPTSPEAGDALYWMAYFAKSDRKYADAAEFSARLVKEYPDHGYAPEAAYEVGENKVLGNKYFEAVEAFKEAYAKYPDTGYGALSLVRVGEVLVSQQYSTEDWQKELSEKNDAASRIALLSIPLRAGDREKADEALAKLDSFKMNEAQKGYALAMKAGCENLAGAYKKAAQTADEALELTRECGENVDEALYQRAEAAFLAGEHDEAVPYYDELLQNFVVPNAQIRITALLNRSQCALETKDAATVDKYCQEALSLRPSSKQSAAAVLMRAQACQAAGKTKEAAQFYKRVTVLYGKMPEYAVPAYKGLIACYGKLGLKNEQEEAKTQFKARYPNDAE